MIAEIGMVLLAFFAGVYWSGKKKTIYPVKERCYVCNKIIGAESSVTDHKRHIFYHFGCWTRVVKHDVFGPPNDISDI